MAAVTEAEGSTACQEARLSDDVHALCLQRAQEESMAHVPHHQSTLPTFFYLLSFAAPMAKPWHDLGAFLRHPYTLYLLGTVLAILAGFSSFPVLDMVYGLYWTTRITYNAPPGQIRSASNFAGTIMIIAAVVCLLFTWLFQMCFAMAASQLTVRLRRQYVVAVLCQDACYFDQHGAGEVATHADKEINAIRTSMGEKLGMTIFTMTILTCSLIIGFSIAARVTGFLFAVVPIVVLIFTVLGYASDKVSGSALRLEGRASSFLEEVLGSIRIVQSFGMGSKLLAKYEQELLGKAQRLTAFRALIRGAEAGLVYFCLFLTYSASFWWLGRLLVRQEADLGTGLTAFWNLINALFAFSLAVPHLASLLEAMSTIRLLRSAIERQPRIDVRERGGTVIEDQKVVPSFALHNVTMAYPSRPSVASLQGVSLTLEAGKVTALVGPSGSGKSTITSLLLREYDPATANVPLPGDDTEPMPVVAPVQDKGVVDEDDDQSVQMERGEATATLAKGDEKGMQCAHNPATVHKVEGHGQILYSGMDVRHVNLRWLRSQVAVVRQHPQLFAGSILDNVSAGLSGTQWAYRPDVDGIGEPSSAVHQRTTIIRQKVRDALAKAQALDFVDRLPHGIDTAITGGKTGILSGGQRQRLSLARALVREPKVLIIDEGTSAIDTNTEERIRCMLEQEHQLRGMTTVLIAHRLSTVERADCIIVMRDGRMVDQGTHAELMQRTEGQDQTYREMVQHQRAILETEDMPRNNEAIDSIVGQRGRSTTIDPQSTVVDGEASTSTSRSHSSTAASSTPTEGSDGQAMPVERMPSQGDGQRTSIRRGSDHAVWSTTGGRGIVSSISDRPLERRTTQGEMHITQQTSPALDDHTTVPFEGTVPIPMPPVTKMVEDKSYDGSTSTSLAPTADLPTVPTRQVWRTFFQVMGMFRLEFVLGIIGALLAGGIFPLVGWVTGRAVNALDSPTDQAITDGSRLWSLIFLCCAIGALLLITLQSYLLESASEKMNRHLKAQSLSALLRQEVGFFDRAEAASGALASSVSAHPGSVTAATGLVASQALISMANLIGSVILAFVLNWRAAFVTLSPVVVLFLSGWVNIAMLERYEATLLEPSAQGAAFISEAIDAIKEIAAMGRERETLRLFDAKTHAVAPGKQLRYLALGGAGFAISQAAVFATSALIFYYGGNQRADNRISITAVYAIFEAAIISIFAAGRIFQFTGDISRAAAAFHAMCRWFERQPRIASMASSTSGRGQQATMADWTAHNIVFRNVELRYPRRPDHPAIRHLDLTIYAGKHHAFCGTSGSGKSTILQMVQRFYDPHRGTIHVGPWDIRQLDLHELRDGMSYVSQDACLYEGTIRFNLLLGARQGQIVDEADLEAVCQAACIVDFIRSLPHGFDTEIGSKGTQLSGGQRQRLCIARALLKQPRILLLDEATSALDAHAERSVQRALDNAARGRTTLTVAHRLSTIRHADVIHVVEDGVIVESGTHDQLIARRGRYLDLVQAQL